MPRLKKSRRLYNAVANMHNCSPAPQICSHLTRSTTTNQNKTTLSQPTTQTTPRRTEQEKSNEDSKEIADTATYWATSGSNAVNASGTKPTELRRNHNNVPNLETTMPNNKKPKNHDTTPNRVPGASAYRNVPYDKQSTNENIREFRREFKQSQNNYQPTYQVTQATRQTTQPEETNDCYDMDYNDEYDTNSKNL